jgi:hypothetical protein
MMKIGVKIYPKLPPPPGLTRVCKRLSLAAELGISAVHRRADL